jgi:hypothetical protein
MLRLDSLCYYPVASGEQLMCCFAGLLSHTEQQEELGRNAHAARGITTYWELRHLPATQHVRVRVLPP